MPTSITHMVVGGLAASVFGEKHPRGRLLAGAALVSFLPDADVIGFQFGVRYGDFLGHRGFFHSPFFAVLASLALLFIFFRDQRPFSRRWWGYFGLFAVVGVSHGLLDAMTDGGMGIALLAPFDNTRSFLPWTPIPVAPIGIVHFLTARGWHVLAYEVIHLWVPTFLLVGVLILVRRRWHRRTL